MTTETREIFLFHKYQHEEKLDKKGIVWKHATLRAEYFVTVSDNCISTKELFNIF